MQSNKKSSTIVECQQIFVIIDFFYVYMDRERKIVLQLPEASRIFDLLYTGIRTSAWIDPDGLHFFETCF